MEDGSILTNSDRKSIGRNHRKAALLLYRKRISTKKFEIVLFFVKTAKKIQKSA